MRYLPASIRMLYSQVRPQSQNTKQIFSVCGNILLLREFCVKNEQQNSKVFRGGGSTPSPVSAPLIRQTSCPEPDEHPLVTIYL